MFRSGLVGLIAVALLGASLTARAEPAALLDENSFELFRPANRVDDIKQTADGYLWFGTGAGLFRFDGDRWRSWDAVTRPGLGDNHVRRLWAARDGSLWIATGGGMLGAPGAVSLRIVYPTGRPAVLRKQGENFREYGVAEGLPSARAWAFAETADGILWVGTEAGLCRLDGDRFSCVGEEAGLPHKFVSALAVDQEGNLLVGTGHGLAIRRAGRMEKTAITAPVVALAVDASGFVYVGSDRRVFLLDGERSTPIEVRYPVHALFADREGRVLAGTDHGLRRIEDGHVATVVALPEPLQDKPVIAIHRDHEDSLWVGQEPGGVTQIRRQRLWNLGSAEGLPGNVGWAVVPVADAEGTVWFTAGNALVRYRGGQLDSTVGSAALPMANPKELALAPDGAIWVSSLGDGVFRFQDGKATHYPIGPGGVRDSSGALHFDVHGDLWVSWLHGGVSRFAGGTPRGEETLYGEADGLCGGHFEVMSEARDGTMVFANAQGGRSSGLGVLRGGRGRCMTERDGLPRGWIQGLHVDGEGIIWACLVPDGGLIRIQDRNITLIPASALPSGNIAEVVDDGRGHLWMSSANGVLRIRRDDAVAWRPGDGPLPALRWTVRDGMRSDLCIANYKPSLGVDREGRAWVPTQLGFTVIEAPEHVPRARGRLFIEEMRAGAQTIENVPGAESAAPVVLGPGRVDLSIKFTAATFLAPASARFETWLEGFESGFVADTRERLASYRNLPPGRYRFHVRGLDHSGEALGSELIRDIDVRPYLWRTWPFFVGCAALVLGMALLVYRMRVAQLQARFAAVLAERARIARDLHDDVAQGFAALGFHLNAIARRLGADHAAESSLIARAQGILRRFREDTRQTIWDLRRRESVPPTLHQALVEVVDEASAAAPGATVRLTGDGEPAEIPSAVTRALARICREAIANAISHGQADDIEVNETYQSTGAEAVTVAVRDNGRGIDPEVARTPPAGHLGILGMRERAQRLGAALDIGARPGGGTEVKLTVSRAALAGAAAEEKKT